MTELKGKKPPETRDSLSAFSPKELIMFMEELLHRLTLVGNRLDSFAEPRELHVILIPKESTKDTK